MIQADKPTEITTPLYDRAGQPLIVPDWYDGNANEFYQELIRLEPHHCSYPNGARRHPDAPIPCYHKKTKAGVCVHHIPTEIPLLHRDGLTGPEAQHMLLALKDPGLLKMEINAVYGDKALNRQAQKCRGAGFSLRLVKLLQNVHASARRHYDRYRELHMELTKNGKMIAALDPDDAQRAELMERNQEIGRMMGDQLSRLNTDIDNVDTVCKNAYTDEMHWKDLAVANRESLDIKNIAIMAEAKTAEVVSMQHVNAAIADLFKAIEESVREKLPDAEATQLLGSIFERCQSQRSCN